jgi:hypothetical protein
LRAAARDLRRLMRKNRHIAIDFNQGFIARPGPSGIDAAPTTHPFTTPALALMLRPNVDLSVINFSHAKLMNNMTTVTFTGEDMMIRGHNNFNDSRQTAESAPVHLTPLDADGEAHFRATYGIDADAVRRVFSAP